MHKRTCHKCAVRWPSWLNASDDFIDRFSWRNSRDCISATTQNCKQVLLSPHHTFWHSCSAAGVEKQHVVFRQWFTWHNVGHIFRYHVVVVQCPLWKRSTRFIGHHVPPLHLRQTVTNLCTQICEYCVEHHCFSIGVVKQIQNLFRSISVVGIYWHVPTQE